MSKWTYSRGRWSNTEDYPESTRAALAKERLRKWDLQDRWVRFPQLGPVPEKWLDVGSRPTGLGAYASECLTAFYLDPISHQLNQPSVLFALLNK